MFKNIPTLSHIERDGEHAFWITESGIVGLTYRVGHVDIETDDLDELYQSFGEAMKKGESAVVIRLQSLSDFVKTEELEHSRTRAIEQIGRVEKRALLTLETQSDLSMSTVMRGIFTRKGRPSTFNREMERLKLVLASLPFHAETLQALSDGEIGDLFRAARVRPVLNGALIETGTDVISICRLRKLSDGMVSNVALALAREVLPLPFELSVTYRPISRMKAELILKHEKGMLRGITDSLTQKKHEQVSNVLDEVLLSGMGLLELEFQLVLRRRTERDARDDLATAIRILTRVGEFYPERSGVFESWLATLPGGGQHVTQCLQSSDAPFYLPIVSRGVSDRPSAVPKRALALHRADHSVMYFDNFHRNYDSFSELIIGEPGRGKSVLLQLKTAAVLSDPRNQIIKVETGDSAGRECRELGGEEVNFSISEPSGQNPFEVVSEFGPAEDACCILANFICVLSKESNEYGLTKAMKGDIEKAVLAYATSAPKAPCIDDFLSKQDNVPRAALLARWGSQGIYRNVMKSGGKRAKSNRYRLFKFKNLEEARDLDFTQGGLGIVFAQISVDMLRAGKQGIRLHLYCDEANVVIERHGEFFMYFGANVRKAGHSMSLATQHSANLVVRTADGRLSDDLFGTTPTHWLFSVSGDEEQYKTRHRLNDVQLAQVKALRTEKGKYAEVFLRDKFGGRVVRIILSPDEYWRSTSDPQDRERLVALTKAVPGLTMEAASRCLAESSNRA